MANQSNPPSTSGDLDPLGQKYQRRMTEQRLQQLADSAILKVMQYAVTAIAIPLIGWGLTVTLDRLKAIEDSINSQKTQAATFEIRVQALERAAMERDAAIKVLTESTMRNTFEIQRIDARNRSDQKR